MHKIENLLFFSLFSLLSLGVYGNVPGKFTTSGHARFRWETRNDVGYKAATHDNKQLRFRPAFEWQTEEKIKVLFEPQFSRTFGSDGNSGGVTDPTLSLHRAQIWANWSDKVYFLVGRQKLSYGDQMIISPLEWSNVARVFDAVKARVNLPIGKGKLDIIDATMNTNGTSATLTDDLTLKGVYSMWSWGSFLKEMDLYYLVKKQENVGSADAVNKMWGVRVKSKIKQFDYRIEYTSQTTETRDGVTADLNGEQKDIELGYTMDAMKTRIAVEWFQANDEYDHMMPLAHSYLGIADVLGRSNITGYAFHLKMAPVDKWWVKLDYHSFERDTVNSNAISIAPNQVARTATSVVSN
jgi:hypothetical protein